MITAERLQIILDLLSTTSVLDLQKLVHRTKWSESTIRRDLSLLEEKALNLIGGGLALSIMVPVLAGFIASGIGDCLAFSPGMVGVLAV